MWWPTRPRVVPGKQQPPPPWSHKPGEDLEADGVDQDPTPPLPDDEFKAAFDRLVGDML